jgi:hypothetical protein
MRELKFRAWVKEVYEDGELAWGGYMVDSHLIKSIFVNKSGSLMNGPRGTGIEYFVQGSFLPGMGSHERASFDEIELMQYTGLTDRNGKEIWEGDIVKNHGYHELCIINYHESQYIGRYKPQTPHCDLDNEKDMHYIGLGFYVRARNSIEVIGNIYEQPHLIEQKS